MHETIKQNYKTDRSLIIWAGLGRQGLGPFHHRNYSALACKSVWDEYCTTNRA